MPRQKPGVRTARHRPRRSVAIRVTTTFAHRPSSVSPRAAVELQRDGAPAPRTRHVIDSLERQAPGDGGAYAPCPRRRVRRPRAAAAVAGAAGVGGAPQGRAPPPPRPLPIGRPAAVPFRSAGSAVRHTRIGPNEADSCRGSPPVAGSHRGSRRSRRGGARGMHVTRHATAKPAVRQGPRPARLHHSAVRAGRTARVRAIIPVSNTPLARRRHAAAGGR